MYVIDAMIPVWNPDARLQQCVEMLLRQSLELRKITLVLSVDDSWDETMVEKEFLHRERIEIKKIARETYNHGGTRHQWAKKSDADILLFLVQDAVPRNEYLAEYMADSLKQPDHAVVYARQIPGFGCDPIEAYTRYFNYPARSEEKMRDKHHKGNIKDCFTSNVCAAYKRKWYERAGGFEQEILLSEDSVFAAKIIEAGAKVIYNAKAQVIHAHCYDYKTQWKRNFDIGTVHRQYREIFENRQAKKEGIRLVKQTAQYLMEKKKPYLMPRLFGLSAVKFLAYQCGKGYEKLPKKLVERWSFDMYYWRRKENEPK